MKLHVVETTEYKADWRYKPTSVSEQLDIGPYKATITDSTDGYNRVFQKVTVAKYDHGEPHIFGIVHVYDMERPHAKLIAQILIENHNNGVA